MVKVSCHPLPRHPKVNTAQTTWDPKTRRFVVDASDLGWRAGFFPQAVEMVSHKTGASRLFALAHTRYSEEGELLAVEYRCGDLTLVVYND
jgi:hypothetical protein